MASSNGREVQIVDKVEATTDYHQVMEIDYEESTRKEQKYVADKMLNSMTGKEDINFDGIAATRSKNSLLQMDAKLVGNPLANQEVFTIALLQDEKYDKVETTTDVSKNVIDGSSIIDRDPIALYKMGEQKRTRLPVSYNKDTILSSIKDVPDDSITDVLKGSPAKKKIQLHQQQGNESFYGIYKGYTLTQYKFHNNQIPSISHHDSMIYNINSNFVSPTASNHSQKQSADASPNTSNDNQNKGKVTVSVPQFKETVLSNKDPEKTNTSSFKCTVCGHIFGANSALTYHMSKKHGIGKFKCDTCNENFAFPSHLKEHKKSSHK